MTTNHFVKGLITGAVVGISMSMIVNPLDSKDVNRIKRNTGRTFTTVGNMLDGIVNMGR